MKAGPLQLTPHEHTGKFRAHTHTSYAGLFFALLLCAIVLVGSSWASEAAVPAVNPQSGSVGLTGTVPGPPPSTAATIVTPRNGSHTSTIPITIAGTCPLGTFVSITKNGVFGGVTNCADDGTFSLQVDLFDGANALVAKVTDALGQFGPDSATVNVIYDAPTSGQGSGVVGKQLFLEVDTTVAATDPGAGITRSATIVGGNGPYAISWDWGDGSTSLLSQANDGGIHASHTYTTAGTYRVTLRVTDSLGNSAFIQIVTVVNGPASSIGATNGDGRGALPGILLTAWPLLILALIMVLFFWLGERREIHKLRRRQRAIEPA